MWHAWEASTYACAGEANRKIWRIKLRVYNTNTFFLTFLQPHISGWIHTYISSILAWCEISLPKSTLFITEAAQRSGVVR